MIDYREVVSLAIEERATKAPYRTYPQEPILWERDDYAAVVKSVLEKALPERQMSRDAAIQVILNAMHEAEGERIHFMTHTLAGQNIWRQRDRKGFRAYNKAMHQHRLMIRRAMRDGHRGQFAA